MAGVREAARHFILCFSDGRAPEMRPERGGA